MKRKASVYHFHNGSGGGVLTVIENLLQFSNIDQIDHHIIYTINKDNSENVHTPWFDNLTSRQIFYYSPRWNFYYTCKKLSSLIPQSNAILVANDWLELGMVTQLGLSNPLVQILHGDYQYYYKLATLHHASIDLFVTVAATMADKLRKEIPARSNDIIYAPFPVPVVKAKSFQPTNEPINILFVGRPTREKGYDLLPLLEQKIRQQEFRVRWHIVGAVTQGQRSGWNEDTEIEFYGTLPNKAVIELMGKMDCLILPSLAEGMPLTLVEAMKVGLTCLVNDLPGGIQELISNGITGYTIPENNLCTYAAILKELDQNRSTLMRIGLAAREKAEKEFDPVTNIARYQLLFEKCSQLKKTTGNSKKVYGSRLDEWWIPNFITTATRNISKWRKG